MAIVDQIFDIGPDFRFAFAVVIGKNSDDFPLAMAVVKRRPRCQVRKAREELAPDYPFVTAPHRPVTFDDAQIRMNFVRDRFHATENRELLGALGAADIHTRDTLAREERMMSSVSRDFGPHSQNLGRGVRNEALVLAGRAASQDDPIAILAGVGQSLPKSRDKAEHKHENHRDQRDAEHCHDRGRAPLHQAAEIVAKRNHRAPRRIAQEITNVYMTPS